MAVFVSRNELLDRLLGPDIPQRPGGETGGAMEPRAGNAPARGGAEREKSGPSSQGDHREVTGGVYVISVAARILEMHPQTLRKYERVGLVIPFRTIGMLRLYSTEDIVRLRLIKHMVDNLGMNLAGVEFALNFLSRMMGLMEKIQAKSGADVLLRFVMEELEGILGELVNMPQPDSRSAEELPRRESQ